MPLSFIMGETTRSYLRVRKGWIGDRLFQVTLKYIAESTTVTKRGRLRAERS